ncbi:hypothetical protein GCM10009841_33110 [Microlunatus panaciterrae]|uniref:Uncharacterized protein n=1 Tax=Microlunatus panaciterrae TaxID=400768 RepID=A0ABS2RG28_9ACTN|nr:hypothetical protein [Microlunatus panaciterrae]MBM7797969.1 hypothetical protein [Microlunatus panaciterrae]
MAVYPGIEDPLGRAIVAAGENLRRADVGIDPAELEHSPEVLDSVHFAIGVTEVDAPPGVQRLLQGYTAESVALGAMIRAANEEPQLTEAEIHRVKEIFEFLLNNIFRR